MNIKPGDAVRFWTNKSDPVEGERGIVLAIIPHEGYIEAKIQPDRGHDDRPVYCAEGAVFGFEPWGAMQARREKASARAGVPCGPGGAGEGAR